jgi:5-hydroxyisourate hydrolase
MSQITTHVLDTSEGKPAGGIAVVLERLSDSQWMTIAHGTTDNDGRVKNLLAGRAESGTYRLSFEVSGYFRLQHKKSFYPSVKIEFIISDDTHYHVPLLLSPFGYSTYRGS